MTIQISRTPSLSTGCCAFLHNLWRNLSGKIARIALIVKNHLPFSCCQAASNRTRQVEVIENISHKPTAAKTHKIRPHRRPHSHHVKKPVSESSSTTMSAKQELIQKIHTFKVLGLGTTQYDSFLQALEKFSSHPTWKNLQKVKNIRLQTCSEIDKAFSQGKKFTDKHSVFLFESRLKATTATEASLLECVKACDRFYLEPRRQ